MHAFMYLLMARSGMYDDVTTWVVATFFSLDEAEAYRNLAHQASVDAIAAYRKTSDSKYAYFSEPTRYDLSHAAYDTAVSYWLEPVPLVQGTPTPDGLFAQADAFATEVARVRELNHAHRERTLARSLPRFGPRLAPELLAPVKHDFGNKLADALKAAA